jgi:uncharacterized protein
MANKGRIWQVDEQGFLISDAKLEHIKPPFKAVVDDVIQAYIKHIGQDLHSIYVTGSVPRGLATVGQSDLDIIAILEYYTDPELVMQDWVSSAEDEILDQHDCVSDVQMEIYPHGWLLHDESEFSISAFVLKTHAVCVWGIDMSPDLTDYKFSDKETRIAIANDDIVQLEPDIDEAIDAIKADDSPINVQYRCKRICKNMIHAAFGLVMVDEAVHTRDIDVSISYFLKHYSDQQSAIQQAVKFIELPTGSAQDILQFLESFGAWLIAECDRWLDTNNPERDVEYQFERDDEL